MKRQNKILFICRKNDAWSLKIHKILKKNFSHITIFYSKSYNEKINSKIKSWKGDYIFSFRSLLILPNSIIKNAKIAAVNFHPGPPEYRGVGCLNYSVFNNESHYGVTAHLMNHKIDSGKILKVLRYRISRKKNLDEILEQTHQKLFLLIILFINLIADNKFDINKLIKNNKEKWSKVIKLKSDLDKFYIINKKISKINLQKKLRATMTKKFKPYIVLHNQKFYYSDEK
jgi:methionyl-tRNA formyltransferase